MDAKKSSKKDKMIGQMIDNVDDKKSESEIGEMLRDHADTLRDEDKQKKEAQLMANARALRGLLCLADLMR